MTNAENNDIHKLYREGSANEPPAALDRAILIAARDSVAPSRKPRPWWLRSEWAASLRQNGSNSCGRSAATRSGARFSTWRLGWSPAGRTTQRTSLPVGA